MKPNRTFIWILFIAASLFIIGQSIYVTRISKVNFNIVPLELAGVDKGKAILTDWYETPSGSLIPYARVNTIADYFLIIGYTGVLLMISARLRQGQPGPVLFKWLHYCTRFAVAAAILDLFENGILLFDMHHYLPCKDFVSARYVSMGKWGLIILIIIVWIITLVRRWMTNKPGPLK